MLTNVGARNISKDVELVKLFHINMKMAKQTNQIEKKKDFQSSFIKRESEV